MKKQHYINFSLIILLLLGFTNCSDLDYDETSFNRKETVFSDFARSKSFLTGIYAYLPTDFNSVDGAMRSSATDDAEHVNDLSNVQQFNDGTWSAIQPLDNVWNNMYAGIRASNLFLKESAGQTFPELQYNNTTGNDYKDIILQYNNYPFEARFLRAFFYFELAKRYKNIPLETTVLTPEEAINVKQANFEDVIKFIVSECDAIAVKLPLSYADFSSAKETGRATRGAALALKARALLYAASPLHSADDVTKWQSAALASKAIIDLSPAYSLASSYSTIVNTNTSPETIFERREGASNGFESRNFPVGYQGGNTGTCPTQNLVDAYEMRASGLPINLDPRYNPANPYSGRDVRLNQTVILNGTVWKGVQVQSFVGGRNGLPLINATKTGYYLKKYVVEAVSLDPRAPGGVTTREHTWILFRYGEVLLNYAEAMNEAYGPETAAALPLTLTALSAVNIVRRRAGMPNFPVGLSKDAFRTKLRNERRVELAFEDHRFWDIRRWKIGDQTKNILAMNITLDASSNPVYVPRLLEVRSFEERNYFYPIPQSEIFKNTNLKQNTGW